MSQDISKDPKQELQAKIAAANRRGEFLLIVLGITFLVTILAWVLFHYELKTACYFRDNLFLRDLWPPNATALSQMQSLPYSEGDQCTFEVLLGRLDLQDAALSAIAEIIHDLDLKDQKFDRKETAGVQQLLAGIVASQPSDDARIERATNLFDDLYHAFERAR